MLVENIHFNFKEIILKSISKCKDSKVFGTPLPPPIEFIAQYNPHQSKLKNVITHEHIALVDACMFDIAPMF